MNPFIKSLGKQTWRVTLGNKSRVFYGGIDAAIKDGSIWIQGGCK